MFTFFRMYVKSNENVWCNNSHNFTEKYIFSCKLTLEDINTVTGSEMKGKVMHSYSNNTARSQFIYMYDKQITVDS